MQHSIQIIRKKVKNANLKVKPNLEVILTIPHHYPQHIIDLIIEKRHDWITKKLEYFQKNKPTAPKELISGENIKFLGKEYYLKVIQDNYNQVTIDNNFVLLTVQNTIESWYKQKANLIFLKLIEKYSLIVNLPVNRITIRKMKTRWGSCNPYKGYINLNLELIKKPIYAIEYVVLHELTHLIHYNHDKNFYNYIAKHMPDWKKRKNMLITNN